MSEKNTDRYMQNEFINIFDFEYKTYSNKELFKKKIPDGWYIINTNIIIIENKNSLKLKTSALKQLNIYAKLTENKFNNIYCIFGYGITQEEFNYIIYKYEFGKLINLNKKLINIKNEITPNNENFTVNINPHIINQYLYNNSVNFPKTQKTLFLCFILIVLKIDNNFYEIYKNYDIEIIIEKMLEIITNKYNDTIFTEQFRFIQKSLHKKYILKIMNMLKLYINNNSKVDILNQFYNEFCIYDKNNESSLGIVLTPDDIVNLMVTELHINSDDIVLDTCTGTGSFLIKSSLYTQNIIGCENNEERYALAKCNFILNNINTKNLYYESCFNIEFQECSKLILNPPFSCNCVDENVNKNDTNWRMFKNEQKFLLYAIQYLKNDGLGAVIIPRSNFSNGNKKSLIFKQELLKHITPLKIYNCNNNVFSPTASVECSILIFIKKQCNNMFNIEQIDYNKDGFKIKNNLRIKVSEPEIIKNNICLNYNDEWNYNNYNLNINIELLYKLTQTYITLYKCFDKLNFIQVNKSQLNINYFEHFNNSLLKFKSIRLNELLEPIKFKSYTFNNNIGDIPLYGATQLNQPTNYINNYSYDSKNNFVLCINKTGNGGAGYVHLRHGKFALNSTVALYNIKQELFIEDIVLMNEQLSKILSRANSLNNTKFNEISINILDCEK